MRKLLLISSNNIHLWNYYDLIKKYFNEIIVVTNKNEKFRFKYDNIFYIKLSLKNPFLLSKSINELKNIIKLIKPNIIHCHQLNVISLVTILALTKSKLKIPIVATAWGSDILVHPKKNFLFYFMVKYILKNINFLTCDSNELASKAFKIYPIKNIKIANFCSFEENDLYYFDKKENIIFSNRLHKKLYQIDKIIIGFYEFLQRTNESWKLIIAGEGKETEKLKNLVTKLKIEDYVNFTGWLDKESNNNYYKKSKIFISLPKSDATSISLLEAMYYGCIPIVSYLPSNSEWVLDNFNGIIVTKYKSIAETIVTANNMSNEKVEKINRQIILSLASRKSNYNAFTSIYYYLRNV